MASIKNIFSKNLKYLVHTFRVRQPKLPAKICLKSGIKGMITISILSAIGFFSGMQLVIAPFASSCITVFTSPEQDYAQPINVIGGYFIATLVGILMINILPKELWILGIMLAVTISAMAYFRVTHPPAGGIPFVIYFYHQKDSIDLIFYPVMFGSLIVVLVALMLHSIPFAKREYPRRSDNAP